MPDAPPPTPAPQHGVTHLLDAAARGDTLATDRLFPLVYAELRRIAGSLMKGHNPGTLQPTALVSEAYLKLVGGSMNGGGSESGREPAWDTRAHFFGAAARAMKQILIDHARRVKTARRDNAEFSETQLPTLDSSADANQTRAAGDLLHLDAALEKLAAKDTRQHQVVMLRFFAGLTIEQTALAMALSQSTVKSEWTFARAWLLREVERARAAAASGT
ncbi:MAG TPA: ECF-type sigma factor [Phycisphaerales bacterium]|nr:ECF-type sigma factor [Phycisphaerales bacterium]